ncbi:MAG TPA: cupredoxin domain-containing protein [Acidimicrobiia bacterium]|nr:cupredoxin domain-containing protein [Acidimicrobiia bacterium]
MRKLVALTVVAIAGTALVGGVALAAKNPPVQLQGKVTNKGEKTVKKGKISIEADDFYFKSTFLKAKPGATVKVSLKNEGNTQHTFTIDGLGVDQTLNPDQKATVTVTLPASGATNFYCRFHGPQATNQGMQGAFFSKKGESVTTGGGAAAASAGSAPTATTTASTSSSGSGSGY